MKKIDKIFKKCKIWVWQTVCQILILTLVVLWECYREQNSPRRTEFQDLTTTRDKILTVSFPPRVRCFFRLQCSHYTCKKLAFYIINNKILKDISMASSSAMSSVSAMSVRDRIVAQVGQAQRFKQKQEDEISISSASTISRVRSAIV